MNLISQFIVLIVAFVSLICSVQATDKDAATSISATPEKNGCRKLIPFIRRRLIFNLCDTETELPCSGDKICCPTEFGSLCKIPTYIKPSKTIGCPPINTQINCIWFNEQCNSKDKKCPADSICCSDNCGSFCVKKKKQPQTNPIKRCPRVQDPGVVCIWFNEQCNDIDKKCPADSICCGNNCGTSCV